MRPAAKRAEEKIARLRVVRDVARRPDAPAHVKLAGLPWGGVAVAVGLPSSGKTTEVEKAAEDPSWERTWVYDPFALRDRANWARGYRARKPWFQRHPVVTIDELLRQAAARKLSLLDARRCKVVVCATGGSFDKMILARDFSTLVSLLEKSHAHSGLASTIIAEEAPQYGRNAVDAINLVANGGAHLGMRLVGISQRWGRFQKDARENVSLVVAGAIASEEDRDALAARCGDDFAARAWAIPPPVNGRPAAPPIAWRLGERAAQKET